MTVTVINIGAIANDGTGDSIRDAFDSVNTSLLTLDNQNYFNTKLFNSNLLNNDTLTVTSIVTENTINTDVLTANIINYGGVLTLSNTTQATNSASGALVVAGGAGIAGNVYVGSNLYVSGTIIGTIAAGSSSFTNIDNTPIGLSIPNDAGFVNLGTSGVVTISNTLAATSNTTGALRVTGGISTRGNLYASNTVISSNVRTGNLSVSNRVIGSLYLTGSDNIFINGSPVTTSAAVFAGGIIPGQVRITSSIPSTSTSTGALIVTGGVGIGGNLNIVGTINAGGQFVDSQGVRVADIGLFPNNTVAGTILTPGQPNITSVGSLLGLTVAGNIEAGLSNQYRIGSSLAPFLRVFAFQVSASQIDGTIITAAQPQITSLGTLTGLSVAGNIAAGNLIVPVISSGLIGNTTSTVTANLVSANVLSINTGNIANVTIGNVNVLFSNVVNSNINNGQINNFSSPNVFISGGNLTVANIYSTLGQFNNFSSGNILAGTIRATTGNIVAASGTATVNTTTGALVVSGGAGISGAVITGGNIVVTSTTDITDVAGQIVAGALIVQGGAGVAKSLIVQGDLTVKGAILATQSVASSYSGLSIFEAGIIAANVRSGDIGNIGALLTGTLTSTSSLQPNITSVGVLSGVISNGNILANSQTVSTSTTTGALVVDGGVGISGALFLNSTGEVSANIGTLFLGNLITNANLGAYQTFANTSITTISANVGTLFLGNLSTNANLGAYQIFANANVSAIQNQIFASNANIGSYQTFANANVSAIQNQIFASNANIGSYQTFANANVSSIQNQIFASNANIGAYQIFANANVSSLQNQIFASNANIGAYRIFANANVSAIQNQIFASNANIGAYQIFANANVSAIQNQIFASNANIGAYQTFANANVVAIQANLGAYQAFANANVTATLANVGTLFLGNINTNANLGSFQTYANTKIGTNTNSNLVVISTTPSTSNVSGALVVGGGAGINGNVYAGGNIIVGYPTTLPTGYPLGSLVMAGRLGIKTTNSPFTFEAVGGAHFYGGQINTVVVPGPATGVLSLSGGSLPGSVVYSVRITAIDEFGQQTVLSNFSNQLTTSGAASSISYSWSASISAVSYRVYVYTGSSPVLQGYFNSTTNSFTLTTLTAILTNSLPFGSAGNVLIRANAASTNSTTGALVVLGGIGVGGTIWGGANINVGTGGGLVTDQAAGYLFNEGATTVKIGGGAVTRFENNTQAVSSSTGAVLISGGLGIVSGNIHVSGSAGRSITTTGNVGINATTEDALRVAGGILVNVNNNSVAITNGGTDGTGDIGAIGQGFNTVYAKATSAQYADLAEIYVPDRHYEPGTVVVIGGDNEITDTVRDHDPRVAGIISTSPAYLMNNKAQGLPVALTGRVPCMVIGPVEKGDLLVTSRLSGVAQKMDPEKYKPGCVLGKSLENIDVNEIRLIEVLAGRL